MSMKRVSVIVVLNLVLLHSQILKGLGYITRSIGLRKKNVAYGGFGMGRIASEVWSNKLKKWVFVDPQFSLYVTHNQYLNFYDMYLLKKQGEFDEISFHISPDYIDKYKRRMA